MKVSALSRTDQPNSEIKSILPEPKFKIVEKSTAGAIEAGLRMRRRTKAHTAS